MSRAAADRDGRRRRARPDEARRVPARSAATTALAKARALDAERGHRRAAGLGAPRPRRRVLPDRPQVELRPEAGAEPEPALPRRQRRRVGAGQLQGQRDPRARAAPLHRGVPDHGARRRGEERLRLHPRRVPRPVRDPRRRARGDPRPPGHPRRRHDRRPPRRGRLHLRRGDGAARLARGQARPAAHEAAVPGDRRASTPRRPSSTTSRRSPPSRRSCAMGAAEYAKLGVENSRGTRLVSVSGPRRARRQLRDRARRRHAARPDLRRRPRRRDPRRPRAQGRDPGRLLDRDPEGATRSTSATTSTRC